jgi:DNA-nicking Smr family endonuclease
MSRRRHLSDDEQTLWDGFTRAIKPLKPKAKPADKSAKTVTKTPTKPSAEKTGVKPVARPTAKILAPSPVLSRPAPSPPPLAPLGRRMKQRVARGREPIDARIDLHGMTQQQAHGALLHFLHRAQADGVRTVLIVTGKGLRKQADSAERERGVLKRQVPLWLALPEFRPLIVGFDDAHVGHGGEGALYVRLRRVRD